MRDKITPNHKQIGVHAYISNGYLNPLSKLNFNNVDNSAYFQPWFEQPSTRAKIAPNIIKISVHAYLSNGYLNPFSKLNSKKLTYIHLFNLGLTNLEHGTK